MTFLRSSDYNLVTGKITCQRKKPEGIDSMSINPDSVMKITLKVLEMENRNTKQLQKVLATLPLLGIWLNALVRFISAYFFRS